MKSLTIIFLSFFFITPLFSKLLYKKDSSFVMHIQNEECLLLVLLGQNLEKGLEGVNDNKNALKNYKTAAKLKCKEAYFALGMLYKNKLNKPKKGFKWLKKAGNKSHKGAQFEIGMMYLNNTIPDTTDTSSFENAISWLSKASEQNQMDAKYQLAMIYREKLGMPWRGAALIHEAAEQGHPDAQYEYGIMCQNVEIDDQDLSISMYLKAAEQGHSEAQSSLGDFYHYTKSDPDEAFFWYQKAADNNHPNAQYHLGKAYLAKDNIERAIYWLKEARKQGHELAHFEIMSIKLELHPESYQLSSGFILLFLGPSIVGNLRELNQAF